MPSLFGALSARRDLVDFAGDFAELKLFPEQRIDVHELGSLRLASCERRDDAPRIARCVRSGAILLLKGVVDLEPEPGQDGADGLLGDALARRVLARAVVLGAEGALGLPGHYAAILWEPRLERLSIATDELGLYPIYWHARPELLLFGTDTRSFVRARSFRREADPRSVVELLRVEYLLADHAMVRDVRLLPPGALLQQTVGCRPEIRRPRRLFVDRPPEPGSLGEAAGRLARAYDRTFRRVVPKAGSLVIPLSGGKDSRTVACEILRADPGARSRIDTISLGSAAQWDARCARRLARTLDLRWRRVDFDATLHARWLDRYTALMDGSSSVFATWWAAILESLGEENGGATIATGFLGDALSGAHLHFFSRHYEDPAAPVGIDPGLGHFIARLGIRCWSREALARTLRPDVAAAWLDAPDRTLEAEYRELSGAPPHIRMMRVDLYGRQRRFIASQLHLYRQRYRVAAPFADPAMLRAFLSLGEAHLRDQAAYRQVFADRHRAAARLMETGALAPLQAGYFSRIRCRAEVAAIAARDRLASRLLGARRPRRNFFGWDHVYDDDLSRNLEPLERYFEPDALRAELVREPADSNRVRLLYTVRAWLRSVEREASRAPLRS